MKNIFVTKTFSAPFDEFVDEIKDIWDTGIFSNDGSKNKKFNELLCLKFSLSKVLLMCNGTLPIQIALKSFIKEDRNEVITTPFSYIATTNSILWENGTPVFVDIDPVNLTIDVQKIEQRITPKTVAILATHVYGNPCDVEALQELGVKYMIPVIYDGAHAVGVKYKNSSLLSFGDITTTSFHATKVLHTGEGGMAVINNPLYSEEISRKMNFGHISPTEFGGIGINAKMSELNAAMGICNLRHLDLHLELRSKNFYVYNNLLKFKNFSKFSFRPDTEPNYSYYPIIFNTTEELIFFKNSLEKEGIFSRRYFYPSLSTLNFLPSVNDTPIANSISNRILCLPISGHYSKKDIEYVSKRINKIIN